MVVPYHKTTNRTNSVFVRIKNAYFTYILYISVCPEWFEKYLFYIAKQNTVLYAKYVYRNSQLKNRQTDGMRWRSAEQIDKQTHRRRQSAWNRGFVYNWMAHKCQRALTIIASDHYYTTRHRSVTENYVTTAC